MNGLKNPREGDSTFLAYLLLLLFILLNSMPTNVKALAQLELGLYFIPLFFIGLTAESDATPVFVALFGFLNDILSEMPLGFWSSLFVVFYLLCVSQRAVISTGSFGSYWITYGVLIIMTYLAAYLLAALSNDLYLAIIPFVLSCFICILFFPVIYFPLYFFSDAFTGVERN
jgi:hypothetical protein